MTPGEITGIASIAVAVVAAVIAAFRARDVHAERQTELHAATVERARVEHNAEVARRFLELRDLVGMVMAGQADLLAGKEAGAASRAELQSTVSALAVELRHVVAELASQVDPRHADRSLVQRLVVHVEILDRRVVALEARR